MKLPVIPTLLVVALLAQYAAAAGKPEMAFPRGTTSAEYLFRKAGGMCLEPVTETVESGRNMKGESGWRHIIACRTGAEGSGMIVDIGWSRDFKTKSGWRGGPVSGTISQAPDHRSILERTLGNGAAPSLMIVSTVAAPGLEPSSPPRLEDIPNNHLAYAVQWFLFAGIAVLIYGIALWRRQGR
jgi:surfeit locus 1 family protein